MTRFLDDRRGSLAEGPPDFQAHYEQVAVTLREEYAHLGIPITLDTLDAFALGAVTVALALGLIDGDEVDPAVGHVLVAAAAIKVPQDGAP